MTDGNDRKPLSSGIAMQVLGGPELMQFDRPIVAGGGIAVLVLSLLAMQGNQWWTANLLTNFHLHMAVAGLAILAAGAVWRRWFQAAIGVAIVAINIGLIAGQLPAPAAAGPLLAEKSLRVMTLNVLFANHDAGSLRRRLVDLDPDVVLLQEVNRRWDRDLAVLDDLYPYRIRLIKTPHMPDQHGTVLLSRYPFAETARPRMGNIPGHLTAARISVTGLPLWIASAHLVKPNTEEGQALQRLQLLDLTEWLIGLNEPFVLGGDFNATLYTPQLEQMVQATGVNTDTQAAPWWGVAFGTYPAWLPVLSLKIDHIMARSASIRDAEIVQVPGSDHRGVIATVYLSKAL